jgi:ATP-dependent 26S proteasome regulatory subunit
MANETLTVAVKDLFMAGAEAAIFRSRIGTAVRNMVASTYNINPNQVEIAFGRPQASPVAPLTQNSKPTTKDSSEKEEEYSIPLQEPQFSFDQLILEDDILEELEDAIKFEAIREKVYKEWGLEKIEPNSKQALNFWGDSGTGKTMAAHAIASKMGKKIILASYAEIESKYHGDGPKNVKKLFQFAQENDAVLFIDEADSLLSKRLTNVTQGSEQAINSMRSQLLIQIEQFSGMVIFATNLAKNYDNAFVTRIRSIHFTKPSESLRVKLWEKMLLPTLPIDSSVSAEKLATIDDVCGRDIKNAVVKTARKAAVEGRNFITEQDLERSIRAIIESNQKITGKPLSEEEKKEFSKKYGEQIKQAVQEKANGGD